MRQRVTLVDDLRGESGGTRGQLQPERRPVALLTAIARALEASRAILDARGHSPIVHCRDDRLAVDGDPARLAQILSNLLSTCVKHSEPGAAIAVTVERDGDEAVITVSDTGIGIPPDYLEDVFGVSGYRRGGAGAGGAFTLRLPAIASSVSMTNISRATEPAMAVNRAPARRILVVDDNDDAAALLAVLLELEGHEVQTAANGGDAVNRAESFRPEVVLMDLEMPGVDGFEASRRIRARPWGNTILIAALTGWGREVDRRRAREAGVDLHFVKPVDTTTLLGEVARSLHDGRRVNLP